MGIHPLQLWCHGSSATRLFKLSVGLCSTRQKDSTEGFNCSASDNLLQSDTVLGKNENLYESVQQSIFMKECLDFDRVDQVELRVSTVVRWCLALGLV